MKVQKFVDDYNLAGNKEKFLKESVTKTHVSFEDKINNCSSIAQNTSFILENGVKVYNINSTARYMLFATTLISGYTDIEFDYSNIVEEFDLMDKYDLFNKLTPFIPNHEYVLYADILQMTISDVRENNRDLTGFLDKKISNMSKYINYIDSYLEGIDYDEEKSKLD